MGWGQFYRLKSKGSYQITRRFTSEKKGVGRKYAPNKEGKNLSEPQLTRLTQMIVAVLTHTSNQFPKLLLRMPLVRNSSFGEHRLPLKIYKKNTMEPCSEHVSQFEDRNAFTHSSRSMS